MSAATGLLSMEPSRRLSGSSGTGGVGEGSAMASSGESRFSPNSFQYNGRVAVALIPCILVLLGAGGLIVLGTLVLGLLIAYILDVLDLKEGSFIASWITAVGVSVSLFLSGVGFSPDLPKPLSMLILGTAMAIVFLTGIWISIQFKWLQLQHPAVVLAMERLLFATCPLLGACVQTWAIVAAMGISRAPYYLMAILAVLFWLFSNPQPSSFRTRSERSFGGQLPQEALINGALESAFHAMALVFFPALFYVGIHWPTLLTSYLEICDVLLLFFLPLLFLLFASTRGALWWLCGPQDLARIRVVNGAIAVAVIVGCIEIRVIFHSFANYIHVSPPFSYVLVTLAIYGAAVVSAGYALGSFKSAVNLPLVTVVLVTSALSASIAIGMPTLLLPAPAAAAAYLAQFLSSKDMVSYSIHVLGSIASVLWFLVHNFWYVSATIGGQQLELIVLLLAANATVALAIPGLSLSTSKITRPVIGGLLIFQGLLVCVLENILYNNQHEEDGLYPSYLVVATTVLGLIVTRRMEADGKLGRWPFWLLFCLYVSKLSMIVLTAKYVLWETVILLLAITPPVLLFRDKSHGRMKVLHGWLNAGLIVAAVLFCRYTIFDAIQWWSGIRPSDGLMLGALIFCAGMGMTPMIMSQFSHLQSARRAVVLVISAGLLVIFIRPPLPSSFAYFWDQEHWLQYNNDEVAIYGDLEMKSGWPSWLLLGMVMGSLAGATSALPIQHQSSVRLWYSVAMGGSIGVYLCAQFFAHTPLLHALLVAAMICAAVFVIFTWYSSSWSPRVLPWVFALYVALLPVMYLLEGRALHKEDLHVQEEEDDMDNWQGMGGDIHKTEVMLGDARTSLVGLYAVVCLLMALTVKMKLSALLKVGTVGSSSAKAASLGYSRGDARSKTHVFVGQHRGVQQRRTSLTGVLTTKKMASEGGTWMPGVGNVATLLSFMLALLLNFELTNGVDRAIFFLAPILLLLNQDVNLVRGFGDRQRYFPLTAAISTYLAISGTCRLLQDSVNYYQLKMPDGVEPMTDYGVWWIVKNGLLLLLSLPNHAIFNKFMWDYSRLSNVVLLCVTPLNFLSIVFADVVTIKVLAGIGMVYAIVQYFISRHVRIMGLKYI